MSEEAYRRIGDNKNTKAKTLDLVGCEIYGTLPIELGELRWLEELNLEGNLLSSPHYEATGNQLGTNVQGTTMSNMPHPLGALSSLEHLRKLNLSRTRCTDITPLRHLLNLRSLDLQNTNVIDIRPLSKLVSLRNLSLTYTLVEDIMPIAELVELRELSLGNTKVRHIDPLANFKQLERLSLYNTQIMDLRPLGKLNKLKNLSLYNTPVEDIEPLSNLLNLEELLLYNTHVADIKPLAAMVGLKTLSLAYTHVDDIRSLAMLSQLQDVSLGHTKVVDFRPLSCLTNLKEISLANTSVSDTEPFGKLPRLECLYLYHTDVTDIYSLKPLIQKGIEVKRKTWDGMNGIFIGDSPLTNPPIEIVKQGNAAILKYWEQQEAQGTIPIYEAKLLFVGEPTSGKTSLYRRMFRKELPLPDADEKTRGIDIHRFDGNLPDGRSMRFNVWDFGGQQIYHATHQFFLTKRSLYILLDDTRKSHNKVHDEYFRYWLGLIDLYGGGSPVLIFQNKKDGGSKGIDILGMQERFPQVQGRESGNLLQPNTGDRLYEMIKESAQNLPHIGTKWPTKWLEIRDALEKLSATRAYIEEKEYFELYRGIYPFVETDALALSQWLHDLGVILHFQDESLLKRMVILQNTWATDAVYMVLDDEPIKERFGRFTETDCLRLWGQPAYRDRQLELRTLMEKFELCYKLPESKPANWLVPQLLPVSRPATLRFALQLDDLVLHYHYSFLPKGIVNRLMVRMHRYVKDASRSWVDGVLFELDGSQLLVVVSSNGQEIQFHARGSEAHKLRDTISEDLEAMNSHFHERIKIEKRIPCKCNQCILSTDPFMFEYDRLRRLKEKGSLAQCYISDEFVSAGEMIDSFQVRTLNTAEWQGKLDHIGYIADTTKKAVDQIVDTTRAIKDVVDGIDTFTSLLPRVIQRLNNIQNYQTTIFLDLKQMGERLSEKASMNQEIMLELLHRIDTALNGAVAVMSPAQEAEFESLAQVEESKIAKPIVDRIKLKIPLIPLAVAILTGGQDWKMTALATAMSRSLELDVPISDAVKGLSKAWDYLRTWATNHG